MEYLDGVQVYKVPLRESRLSNGEDEGGWSIIAPITTSHMAIHTWPLRGAFMLDIFSCRPFSMTRAEHIVRERLGVDPNRCAVRYIDRNQAF